MITLSQRLLAQIRQVAIELPTPMLYSVIQVLTTDRSNCGGQSLKVKLMQQLPKAQLRTVVANLFETWQVEAMHLDSKAIATALATAAHCNTSSRQELSVELVWTGPLPEITPLPSNGSGALAVNSVSKARDNNCQFCCLQDT